MLLSFLNRNQNKYIYTTPFRLILQKIFVACRLHMLLFYVILHHYSTFLLPKTKIQLISLRVSHYLFRFFILSSLLPIHSKQPTPYDSYLTVHTKFTSPICRTPCPYYNAEYTLQSVTLSSYYDSFPYCSLHYTFSYTTSTPRLVRKCPNGMLGGL